MKKNVVKILEINNTQECIKCHDIRFVLNKE